MQDIQSIHWLSFLLGALVGWVLEWVLDLLFWRRKYTRTVDED